MNLAKIKKVHLIGLGGIGVSAIAKMMLDYHKEVSGSDLNDSEIIHSLVNEGAVFYLGHRAENLIDDIDLVVYSPAVPSDNPERQKAKKLKIIQLSYPEFLGEFSKDKFTIAVSGTNGKSTTTAILGLILEAAGLDPTVIVGSQVPQWNSNLRLPITADLRRQHAGSGENFPRQSASSPPASTRRQGEAGRQSAYLVVEGCEWQAHMLNLWPKIIVLTNLELDHLDYYRNLDHIIKTFQRYVEKLSPIDLLIINADDPNLKKLKPKCRVITYGIKNQADIVVKNIKVGSGFSVKGGSTSGGQKFDLCLPCEMSFLNEDLSSGRREGFYQICNLKLRVPGLFNIYNVLAASAAALSLGVKPEIIKKTLENFRGIWRRFEIIGQRNGAIIVSDYAHHPTAVAGTIQAAREFFPGRRIVSVFQPHHHNRTKNLFQDFVKSFDQADLIVISEIYDVAGREKEADSDISSKDLVKAIMVRLRSPRVVRQACPERSRGAHHKIKHQKTIPPISAFAKASAFALRASADRSADRRANKGNRILYAKDLNETKKQILANLQPNDLVLIMGAGDIYQIVEDLTE